MIRHQFTATGPNELWLTDISEHWTKEGKLYLCAIKDAFSNRVVGYSIESRMTASLAVNALENAVRMRGNVAGCKVHSRPWISVSFPQIPASSSTPWVGWEHGPCRGGR